MKPFRLLLSIGVVGCATLSCFAQTDPGPRPNNPRAGQPVPGLSSGELNAFLKGKEAFEEVDGVAQGLGPRFNLDSCAGCHSHPSTGGASPAINPQIAAASRAGANNRIPPFIQQNGPVRVVRFRRNPNGSPDGGVHALFVISGRNDAPNGCRIAQPDFAPPNNLTFRIPTPTFGLGLIEAIPDAALAANLQANPDQKRALGINGRFNTNGNDGTITRFGWKAQNKSLLLFSGEAYNVEVGVTNDLFPNEREDNPDCVKTASPESHADLNLGKPADIDLFTSFMRFLAPSQPAPANPSADRGRGLFVSAGCAQCHTPSLRSGRSSTPALSERNVNLYSDLALHRMGQQLADGISQGQAQSDEWRTAPLWGLGDRLFFLHDGRTRDLLEAIAVHDGNGSEARGVIRNFNALPADQKQDLLNFLRSL
jgi:CxxC motif-containing protein (DUF1111 family)